jgi:hypothetical protein
VLSDPGWQSAAPDRLLTSGNRRYFTLDNKCCPKCDNFLYVFKGTPSARQAIRPWPGSWRRHVSTRGLRERVEGRRATNGWGRRGSLAAGGRQLGPLPLARQRTGAGRCRRAVTPHPPRGGPRRYEALGDTGLQEQPGRSPRAGHRVAAQRSQSRALPTVTSFGWRCAPLLSVIFHGKNRHLSGGRTFLDSTLTCRDLWSDTAAPLRHASPDGLPMSAVFAREPDGAHAIGQTTGQACSSPFSPSLLHGRAMANQADRVAAPPADPGLVMPADVGAQAQSRLQAYARPVTCQMRARMGPPVVAVAFEAGDVTGMRRGSPGEWGRVVQQQSAATALHQSGRSRPACAY